MFIEGTLHEKISPIILFLFIDLFIYRIISVLIEPSELPGELYSSYTGTCSFTREAAVRLRRSLA
jgi:hypothetical protein